MGPDHPLHEGGKKYQVVMVRVPEDRVATFSLERGDSLVTDDGEGYSVLDFEWCHLPFRHPAGRILAILIDRQLDVGEHVRIFRTVGPDQLWGTK